MTIPILYYKIIIDENYYCNLNDFFIKSVTKNGIYHPTTLLYQLMINQHIIIII